MTLTPLRSAAALCCLALTVACERAQDQQNKANLAQANANTTIAQVGREADDKMKQAQATADAKIAQAQADFMRLREEYRHDTTTSLVALDKKLADLEVKASTAKGKEKLELDAATARLRSGRDAFVADFKTLETASASTWDGTKERLDKQWGELKSQADAL